MAEIYKIEDDIYHKIYIGQTSQGVKIRYNQHLEKSKDSHDTMKLHKAIRNLGREHFQYEVLEERSESEANEREKYWVNHYNSYADGYNMTAGGNGGSIYLIDDIEIRRMWDDGCPLSEIADMFSCSVKAISSRLANYCNYS